MRWPGFVGPSYTPRSMNVDAERTINLYPETVTDGTGAVKAYLVGTPGLRSYISFDRFGGPVRALWTQNGRAFAVVGSGFYEFFPTKRGVKHGTVALDDDPATICSNGTAGNQILILSAGRGYIFRTDTNVFTALPAWPVDAAIPDGEFFPFPCKAVAFADGYFVALRRDSRQLWCSDLEDGMTWGATAFSEVQTAGDNLRTMVASHRQLWMWGEHNGHVWYNAAAEDFPYVPLEGTSIEHGILAPHSVASLDNTLFWLGSDVSGAGIVWKANGYTPQRVSTHAVEYWLKQASRLSEAVAYAYQDEGHSFYVLYVPGAETTWVYDVATGSWHERATWNTETMAWEPHLGRCHCYAFGRHLVGDRASGTIYEMSLDLYDDDVAPVESVVVSASSSASLSASRSQSLSASRSGSSSVSPSLSPSTSPSASVSPSTSSSTSSSLSASASASGGG